MSQTFSDERLAELDVRLADLNERWEDWDRELAKEQQELEDRGMDWWDALEAVHQRSMERMRGGNSPVAFDEIGELLDELCALYLQTDRQQRGVIRGFFDDKDRIRKHLYSYVGGRAARLLESTGDVKWLRLGLAAASIEDKRVDYRDLLICLGELWLAAEEVGIAPARHFSAVARISSPETKYGDRSTQDLLRHFRRSGHLRSIKRKAKQSRA